MIANHIFVGLDTVGMQILDRLYRGWRALALLIVAACSSLLLLLLHLSLEYSLLSLPLV